VITCRYRIFQEMRQQPSSQEENGRTPAKSPNASCCHVGQHRHHRHRIYAVQPKRLPVGKQRRTYQRVTANARNSVPFCRRHPAAWRSPRQLVAAPQQPQRSARRLPPGATPTMAAFARCPNHGRHAKMRRRAAEDVRPAGVTQVEDGVCEEYQSCQPAAAQPPASSKTPRPALKPRRPPERLFCPQTAARLSRRHAEPAPPIYVSPVST